MALSDSNLRRRFGGFNWVSAFYGWLVATAVAALLTALLSAAGGAVALTEGVNALTNNTRTVGIVSALFILVSLAVAYYAGGYVAGRMSRFNGARQGLGVWIMGIFAAMLLALAGLLFGANYNLLQQLNLPHIPVNQGALTTGGIITLLATLVVTLVTAIAGARVGEHYHRMIDEAWAEEAQPVREPVREELEPQDTRDRGYGMTRRTAHMSFGERIGRHKDNHDDLQE